MLIIDYSTKQIMKTLKDRSEPISCLKYSPKNEVLSVGGYDSEIIHYNVKDNYQLKKRMRAHHSKVLHIDFSENS